VATLTHQHSDSSIPTAARCVVAGGSGGAKSIRRGREPPERSNSLR